MLCLGPATFEALISPLYATLYQPTFPKVISGILLWSCEQVQRVMFWNLWASCNSVIFLLPVWNASVWQDSQIQSSEQEHCVFLQLVTEPLPAWKSNIEFANDLFALLAGVLTEHWSNVIARWNLPLGIEDWLQMVQIIITVDSVWLFWVWLWHYTKVLCISVGFSQMKQLSSVGIANGHAPESSKTMLLRVGEWSSIHFLFPQFHLFVSGTQM